MFGTDVNTEIFKKKSIKIKIKCIEEEIKLENFTQKEEAEHQ